MKATYSMCAIRFRLSDAKATFASISFLILLITLARANPPAGVLKVRMVDSFRVPVNRAFILVRAHGSETDPGVRAKLDSNGYFSVELPSNFYEVFISSPGFSPTCGEIKVEAGKTVIFDAVLRMSTHVNTPD
jgi:hypothetical protein